MPDEDQELSTKGDDDFTGGDEVEEEEESEEEYENDPNFMSDEAASPYDQDDEDPMETTYSSMYPNGENMEYYSS